MIKRTVLAAAVTGFLATPALANNCADLILEVNSRLANVGDSLNEEVTDEIITLRNQGEDLKASDDEACQEKLEEALSLFTQ